MRNNIAYILVHNFWCRYTTLGRGTPYFDIANAGPVNSNVYIQVYFHTIYVYYVNARVTDESHYKALQQKFRSYRNSSIERFANNANAECVAPQQQVSYTL